MDLDPKMIFALRQMTGAGVVDAKNALEEAGGDLTGAAEMLRKKGLAKAARKLDRQTAEGVIHAYMHGNGKVAAMIELLCETDFVARTEEFQTLAHDLAMHVAAANPRYLRPEDVPHDVIAKEKEIFVAEMGDAGRPPDIMEKILMGKLEKFFSETCLVKQTFVKDEDVTIEERVQHAIARLGENIQIRRFVRMSLGE